MTLLLIGYNDGVLTALDGIWPKSSVVVLEERDLWEGKQLARKAARHPSLAEVRFGRYQQDEQYLDVVAGISSVTAVAPGLEYAVEAAATAAEVLDLPGAGSKAASVLRDKLRLREAAAAAGMPGPAFQEVNSADDIARFTAGRPCVVKPANRQASLGVVLLDAEDDPVPAWRECSQADEGNQLAERPLRWRYLVEERLYGPEYSTECLVENGELRFLNVTAKRTVSGRYPVEIGHLVPGHAGDLAPWRRVVGHLIRAVGFGTGILHAEWVHTGAGPVLIECAGRPPGDMIMDLIDLAYRTNLTDLWLRLLAGRSVSPPTTAVAGSAIRFLTCGTGVIDRIDGVDQARRMPGVRLVRLARGPGDRLGGLRSSWDRVGSVIAVAESAQQADQFAGAAVAQISVRLS